MKSKGMLTDEEFSSAKAKLLNRGEPEISQSAQSAIEQEPDKSDAPLQEEKVYKVTICSLSPDDAKQIYHTAKELCKDIGVGFSQAKDILTKGTTLNFKDQQEAIRIIDKYRNMGCKVTSVET